MSNLIKPPFTRERLDEEKDKDKGKIFTVRLNEKEYADLLVAKRIIQQPKDSTTLKILAEIGSNVIQQELNGQILRIVLRNIDKNERLGIMFVEK